MPAISDVLWNWKLRHVQKVRLAAAARKTRSAKSSCARFLMEKTEITAHLRIIHKNIKRRKFLKESVNSNKRQNLNMSTELGRGTEFSRCTKFSGRIHLVRAATAATTAAVRRVRPEPLKFLQIEPVQWQCILVMTIGAHPTSILASRLHYMHRRRRRSKIILYRHPRT
ncbi:unnamed protein product [Trichogramma brassicae]|uniref:Uncharacterized protein n=1 Tax=Trichogramma brassicae TaxID=86971 RepID=A0A6H5IKW7_9HYME|nr:unnamed protein product [Trichogramma brassicae]